MFITLASLFSFPDIGNDDGVHIPNLDKMAHFIFHLVFVVLGTLSLKGKRKERFQLKKGILLVIGVAFLYGIVIEGLQYTMPYGRSAEIFDVLANTVGAIFGGLLVKKYLSLIRKLK